MYARHLDQTNYNKRVKQIYIASPRDTARLNVTCDNYFINDSSSETRVTLIRAIGRGWFSD